MIRRPPRSTLLSLHDALPISDEHAFFRVIGSARSCELSASDGVEAERSEEHTSELQSRQYLVCRLLLEKKKSHLNSNGCGVSQVGGYACIIGRMTFLIKDDES